MISRRMVRNAQKGAKTRFWKNARSCATSPGNARPGYPASTKINAKVGWSPAFRTPWPATGVFRALRARKPPVAGRGVLNSSQKRLHTQILVFGTTCLKNYFQLHKNMLTGISFPDSYMSFFVTQRITWKNRLRVFLDKFHFSYTKHVQN